MTTIIIGVNLTQLDAEDLRAVKTVCYLENKRRSDASVELLDFSTGPLRKTYYESLLVEALKEIHKRNVVKSIREMDGQKPFQDLREAWSIASPEQKAAAMKAITAPVPG